MCHSLFPTNNQSLSADRSLKICVKLFNLKFQAMNISIETPPKEARELAISFLCQEGLAREFVENASLKPEDAQTLVRLLEQKTPSKILEVGTFVGVSSVVLGLCFPPAQVFCVDPNLPTGIMNQLCVKQFQIPDYNRPMLDFVAAGLVHAAVMDRFKLYPGFFSCCFPNQSDRQKVMEYGIDLAADNIIGLQVCETHAPFDAVFLDADHRTPAVLSDLLLLHSYIASDGTIVLHDMGEDFWGKQVQAGVDLFLRQHPEFTLEHYGELGVLQLTCNQGD